MSTDDLLESAQALTRRGAAYALVTVVRTTPPTAACVGAQAIVLADGSLQGTVGGGCTRDVIVEAALAAMRTGQPRLVLISNAPPPRGSEVEQHPMRCASNGEIELFVHPHAPAPLLLVLGNTASARQARGFAAQCGFRLAERTDGPEAAEIALALVATQGEGDEEALQQALASPARQVLLIASKRKAQRLCEAMRLRGVPAARLAAIQAPAGPDIGAHNPAHIALAAVAGAVACWQKGALAAVAAAAPVAASAAYVNPVCGMRIDPREALHVVAWQGQNFYFCCDGCKQEFERDPARYAAVQAGRVAEVTT